MSGIPAKPKLVPPARPDRGRGLDAREAADWLDEALTHFLAVVYREESYTVAVARTVVIDAMDALARSAQPRRYDEHDRATDRQPRKVPVGWAAPRSGPG